MPIFKNQNKFELKQQLNETNCFLYTNDFFYPYFLQCKQRQSKQ